MLTITVPFPIIVSRPFLVALMALALFSLTLILGWPGMVQTDAAVQWYEARTASVTSQHPPFMAFLWHWLDRLRPGPSLMLALQLAVFWAAALTLALRARMRLGWAAATFMGLAASPFLIAREADIMKDVLGGNLMLLGWCLLLKDPDQPWRRSLIAVAFGLMGVACLIRYQFLVAVLPGLVLVLLPSGRERLGIGRAGLAAAALVTALGIGGAMTRATLSIDPDAGRRSLFTLAIYDIAGIVVREPQAALEVFARRGADVTALKEHFAQRYSPNRSDDLLWWPDGGNLPLLRGTAEADTPQRRAAGSVTYDDTTTQWLDLARSHPLALLRHRLAGFGRVMGIGNDGYACWPIPGPPSRRNPAAVWVALGDEVSEPLLASVFRASWFPAGTLLFRPWVYAALSLLLAAGLARQGWRANAGPLAFLAAGWCYWASFLLANAACDVRYSWFPVLATLFMTALFASRLDLRTLRRLQPGRG